MGLASFFFTIFAILGVSLWNGAIHYRCYKTEFPDAEGNWEVVSDDIDLCSDVRECPAGTFCNSKYEVHAKGYLTKGFLDEDTDIYSLNYGITSFDSIGSAFLTIF